MTRDGRHLPLRFTEHPQRPNSELITSRSHCTQETDRAPNHPPSHAPSATALYNSKVTFATRLPHLKSPTFHPCISVNTHHAPLFPSTTFYRAQGRSRPTDGGFTNSRLDGVTSSHPVLADVPLGPRQAAQDSQDHTRQAQLRAPLEST